MLPFFAEGERGGDKKEALGALFALEKIGRLDLLFLSSVLARAAAYTTDRKKGVHFMRQLIKKWGRRWDLYRQSFVVAHLLLRAGGARLLGNLGENWQRPLPPFLEQGPLSSAAK